MQIHLGNAHVCELTFKKVQPDVISGATFLKMTNDREQRVKVVTAIRPDLCHYQFQVATTIKGKPYGPGRARRAPVIPVPILK